MSRLTRDGTDETVSLDQILKRERGQGNTIFPVQLTTSRIGNLTGLILTLAMYGHTYSKSTDQPGKVANPGRDQLNRENGHFPVLVRA